LQTNSYIPSIKTSLEAFGMIMPGRSFSSGSDYRFGFAGYEVGLGVEGSPATGIGVQLSTKYTIAVEPLIKF